VGALACALLLGQPLGSQGDRAHAAPDRASTSAVPAARRAGDLVGNMEIRVTEVRADPSVDVDAIRQQLGGADIALSACLEPDDSTGVVAMKVSLAADGVVEDVSERPTTTYGTDASRGCIERLVEAMRFPAPQGAADVDVTLEVRAPSPRIE
jgi:hypothetical protein